jgi:hypothetical protein
VPTNAQPGHPGRRSPAVFRVATTIDEIVRRFVLGKSNRGGCLQWRLTLGSIARTLRRKAPGIKGFGCGWACAARPIRPDFGPFNVEGAA